MRLKLDRPLIIFDLETTGINLTQDRIIDLFMIKIEPDGSETDLHYILNPGIPIPAESSAIHGIFDADVANAPHFKEVSEELHAFIQGADIGGFNSNKFDFPILIEEFYRVGLDYDISKVRLIDAMRIFHKMEPRNLAAAYSFYCDKEIENAHTAEADTRATWEVLKAQIEKYDTLEPNVDFLHAFGQYGDNIDLAGRIKRNNQDQAVFGFGKHRGKSVVEIFQREPTYYDWMMRGDFPANTKQVITKLRLESKSN